jgi:lysophospholipase L1-like esterase
MRWVYYVLVGIAVCSFGYWLFFMSSTPATNYPSDGSTIVAFGDSLVVGVGATKGNDFVSLLSQSVGQPIVNLGLSGETTRDALLRLDAVIEQDPKVVLLLLGGNDFLQQIPKAETFANLEQMIETIHESGSTVLLLGVRGGLLRDEYKRDFEQLAETHGTAFVPNVLDGLFANPSLMSDAIHPNDAGYQIIADRIQPVLQPLVAE